MSLWSLLRSIAVWNTKCPNPARLRTNTKVGLDANPEISMRQVDAKDKHFWGMIYPTVWLRTFGVIPSIEQQYPHLTCRRHVSAHATVAGRASCDTKSATVLGPDVPTVSRSGVNVVASRCVYNGATAWHRVADLPVLRCRCRRRQILGGRFDVVDRGTCRKIHRARLKQ